MIHFIYSRQAQKDIKRIDKTQAKNILNTIKKWEVGNIPLPTPKMLIGVYPPQYRFRIGNYRIRGYMDSKKFSVLRIRHRSDIYKDL